jgi:D-alanyl-D-alanine dipeptidase
LKRLFAIAVIISVILFSCGNQNDSTIDPISKRKSNNPSPEEQIDSAKKVLNEKLVLSSNLVNIEEVNPKILVDLKYATTDNFMKMKLYARINKAFLQRDVALRLSNCQDYLSKLKPGYTLLIYDAVRPVSVQQKMWDALDSIPPKDRGKFVSNPTNRSLHNLGAAVDLTICNENGTPLDMGANYDDIRKIAYPELESYFLKIGELTKQQIENRELLRKVMRKEGFRNIPTEWWHFNACSRREGLAKYEVLFEEP